MNVLVPPLVADRMVASYAAGHPLDAVGREFGWSSGTVRNVLIRLGQPRRSKTAHPVVNRKLTDAAITAIIARYSAGEASPVLARAYGVSKVLICQTLRKRHLTRSQRQAHPAMPCQEDYFDAIDSEPKAYWLGFLAADGCIAARYSGSLRLRICLNERDRGHIQMLLNDLGSPAAITSSGKRCVQAAVTCDQLTAALVRHGIVRRKTFALEFPAIDSVLIPHWIRGYFDGDGCVSATGKGSVGFTGRVSVLAEIQRELNVRALTAIGIRGCLSLYKNRNHDTAQLHYGGQRSLAALYGLLYDGATRFLQRKHEKFSFLVSVYDSTPAENAVRSVTDP